MNEYLVEAIRVLRDPDQTLPAKEVAKQILINAGYSSEDIATEAQDSSESVNVRVMVFLA